MQEQPKQRIAYIDWLRGFACLVMFQTHCYDSWLSGSARNTQFFAWSQLGGTLPAPLFLFLAGISMALVTDKLREKGIEAGEIARTTILRGGEILVLALLFRMQEFLLGLPSARWTDLFRVDVLNVIGVSLVMMGITCRIAATGGVRDARNLRKKSIVAAVALSAAIAMLTPPLWTTWRPHWRAWWLESYINGVHTFDKPQSWQFPLFPWSAFAFAGLAVGFLLRSEWARRNEGVALGLAGAGGAALAVIGYWLDALPVQLYAVYDFWHTSPNFFLMRSGIVLLLLTAAYLWCRWGAGKLGFSPLIEMGKCSLLVYWVHMEFVYGGFSILPKRGVGIATATAGFLAIAVAMALLAVARNRFSRWGAEIPAFIRRTRSAQ